MKITKVLMASSLIGIVTMSGCSDTVTSKPAQTGKQVLVTHPETSPGDDMVFRINNAKTRVWMEMYSLRDDRVLEALRLAKRRGVDVRVMLHSGYGSSKSTKKSYATLTTNKVPTKWAPSGYIFHIKTTLIDDAAVISTANLNENNYPDHRDFTIVDGQSAHVKAVADTFSNDWKLKGKPKDATVKADGLVWSPKAESQFVSFINSSKTSVDFSSELMRGEPVAKALADASKRGVKCRIHIPRQIPADNVTPAAMNILKGSKCEVTKLDPNNSMYYAHSKQIIVDKSKVLVGSHNNSMTSLNKNRELSVEITQADIVKQFVKIFNEDAKLPN